MSERTWPADWDDRLAGNDCEMCAQGRSADTGYGIRYLEGEHSDAYLQRANFQRGYSVVIWRGDRHVAEPTQLSPDEAAGYWRDVLAAGRLLEEHFKPVKTNYHMLGNALPHLHTHIILRYPDDPSPGAPLLPILDRGNMPEEAVQEDVAALRKLVAKGG